jgi:FkbM family methyltransferase
MVDVTKLVIREKEQDGDIYREVILEQEYKQSLAFKVSPSPNILDLGGHVGYGAFWLANNFPNAKIFSVEPNVDSIKIYEQNCSGIDYKMLNGFVGAKDGLGSFHHVWPAPYSWKKVEGGEIPTYCMGSILNHFELKSIDILKCDIEGSEKDVFENCASWIKKVKNVIVEVHQKWIPEAPNLPQLYKMIRNNGVEIKVMAQLHNRIAFIEIV